MEIEQYIIDSEREYIQKHLKINSTERLKNEET